VKEKLSPSRLDFFFAEKRENEGLGGLHGDDIPSSYFGDEVSYFWIMTASYFSATLGVQELGGRAVDGDLEKSLFRGELRVFSRPNFFSRERRGLIRRRPVAGLEVRLAVGLAV